ncbi:MAG: hypothetical protein LBF89_02160 [Bacteroidales bacterium]|jgi:hypothetical protein|nr:hypothetical protein [Bacteroidales bacterium]
MKNNSSDLHEYTNVEAHGVRLKARKPSALENAERPERTFKKDGRKWETKHGWNSPLTNSTSKKELTDQQKFFTSYFVFFNHKGHEVSRSFFHRFSCIKPDPKIRKKLQG